MSTSSKVYALNLFDISSKAEYLAYVKQSGSEVEKHGGKVVSLGKFKQSVLGELAPRQAMILVEWESLQAFEQYCNDPELVKLHEHRRNGTANYIWQLFDKLENLKPLFE